MMRGIHERLTVERNPVSMVHVSEANGCSIADVFDGGSSLQSGG